MVKTGCFGLVILIGVGAALGGHFGARAWRRSLAKETALLDDAHDVKAAEAAGLETASPGPVKVRGKAVGERPARLPGKPDVQAVYYEVKLKQRWYERDSGSNEKSRTDTIRTWTHAQPFAVDDGSGVKIKVDPQKAVLYVRDEDSKDLPDPRADRVEHGDISERVTRRRRDSFELESKWIPAGADVLAVGIVALGPDGPELAAPEGDVMILSAYDEAGTRAKIGSSVTGSYILQLVLYGVGSIIAIVGLVLLRVSRQESAPHRPAPPPSEPFQPVEQRGPFDIK